MLAWGAHTSPPDPPGPCTGLGSAAPYPGSPPLMAIVIAKTLRVSKTFHSYTMKTLPRSKTLRVNVGGWLPPTRAPRAAVVLRRWRPYSKKAPHPQLPGVGAAPPPPPHVASRPATSITLIPKPRGWPRSTDVRFYIFGIVRAKIGTNYRQLLSLREKPHKLLSRSQHSHPSR